MATGFWTFSPLQAIGDSGIMAQMGMVLDMILMISIVLAVLTITIVYVLKGIYINKFNLKGSLRGFKLSFKTKEKSAPSDQE